MSLYLIGCGKSAPPSESQILDCETWINDSYVDFLTSSPQQKQMSSSLSNIEDQIEADISYELFLKDCVGPFGPNSQPADIPETSLTCRNGRFSGFLFFTPKESGNYHVIVSNYVWIDFIDENSQKVVFSTASTAEKCRNDIIYKVVQFPLEKGERYIFKLLGSEVSPIKLAIKRQ